MDIPPLSPSREQLWFRNQSPGLEKTFSLIYPGYLRILGQNDSCQALLQHPVYIQRSNPCSMNHKWGSKSSVLGRSPLPDTTLSHCLADAQPKNVGGKRVDKSRVEMAVSGNDLERLGDQVWHQNRARAIMSLGLHLPHFPH